VSSKGSTNPVARVQAMRRDLNDTRDRVQELEQQLAARDREIAAVRGQLHSARSAPVDAAPPGTDESNDLPAQPPLPLPESKPAVGSEQPEPAPRDAAEAKPAMAHAPPAAQTVASDSDPRLVVAQRQIARLEGQLAAEIAQRKQVEAEMARLLEETSAGPFDRASGVVEKHLRQELEGARREIAELRTSLATERRERQEIERRYAALQVQLQAVAASARAGGSEEIEALKERQRRVLASIQQDLHASRQRESELQAALSRGNGAGGVSLADEVASLRTENSALQLRLDQEHRQNRDLSAKLQLATRVTDLIFKMQNGAPQPATATAASR
jgi:chromosome segregation ATPase